jgi:hypothetical protein
MNFDRFKPIWRERRPVDERNPDDGITGDVNHNEERTVMVRDKRISFVNERATDSNGLVIVFTGKYEPDKKRLKVYRIEGNITDMEAVAEVIRERVQSMGHPVDKVLVL